MATTTSSMAWTLAIVEITEHIFAYLMEQELAALGSTSKSIRELALDMLWNSITTLKPFFFLIPGCLVSTKCEFNLILSPTKGVASTVEAIATGGLDKVQEDGSEDSYC